MEILYFTKQTEYTEQDLDSLKEFIWEQIMSMSMFQSTQKEVENEIIERLFTYKIK